MSLVPVQLSPLDPASRFVADAADLPYIVTVLCETSVVLHLRSPSPLRTANLATGGYSTSVESVDSEMNEAVYKPTPRRDKPPYTHHTHAPPHGAAGGKYSTPKASPTYHVKDYLGLAYAGRTQIKSQTQRASIILNSPRRRRHLRVFSFVWCQACGASVYLIPGIGVANDGDGGCVRGHAVGEVFYRGFHGIVCIYVVSEETS